MSKAAARKELTPQFFKSAAQFRTWLEKHHETAAELLVGLYKKGTGVKSMTWAEAVREALCFGWIDGVSRRVDDERWAIRFTPRRPGSIWSAVNIAHVAELNAEGRMMPAGLRAFERRTEKRSAVYAFEQGEIALPQALEKRLRAARKAHAFFTAQPAGYRKQATWWILSAKREETRERRFTSLLEHSAAGERLPQYRP